MTARPPKPANPPPATGLDAAWRQREHDRNIEALEELAEMGREVLRALPELDARTRLSLERDMQKTLTLQAGLMANRQRRRAGPSARDAVPGAAGLH